MANLPELMVTGPAALAECCAHLSDCEAVGFDTEFVGENTYHPHLCLIQVATPQRLYLIDPLAEPDHNPNWLKTFWEVLTEPARTVVVHAGREEARLCELAVGRPPPGLFDVQIAAGLVGYNFPLGHAGLVQQVLRQPVAKGETLTDWRKRPLTRQQVRYAYDDVRFLLPLWRKLTERLTALGRLDWAKEEFAHFLRRAQVDNPSVEKWRRLKGLSRLTRRQLAVVRELSEWREAAAALNNRPVRTIVRDDLLTEIARRNPESEPDLAVLRGLPRQEHAEILSAVRRANALPPDELPELPERDDDPPEVGWVTGVLMAALGAWCGQRHLAQSLTATVSDVKHVVRARLAGAEPPPTSALSHGWRAGYVLPDLLALLDGRKCLRIAPHERPTPFRIEE
jgi:ribonuclease D